jgi:ABC-type Fe3+/spermidine/putrescine transport system ATPase subunit
MRSVDVSFGSGTSAVAAVHDINLDVGPGEFVAELGPSGCGKSTLLGAMAGFAPLSAGEIFMDGHSVSPAQCGTRRGLPAPHAFPLENCSWKYRVWLENARFAQA